MAARIVFEERCVISAMIGMGASAQEMGDALDRHPSTVRREITRGGGRDGYEAETAQAGADQRATRPKVPKLVADPVLAEAVNDRLGWGWSPHAVAADLRTEGLDRYRRVCAETIYQACYEPCGRRGLTTGSWRMLPRRRRRRKPRSRCEQANEHTNGILRRWLPKSTNLNIGQIPLSLIEDNLNHMPRRLHNWNSPHDLYNTLTSNHR